MRIVIGFILSLLAVTAGFGAQRQEWSSEVEWGDSIPAGTVYNVKFDSAGHFKAERRGPPFIAGGKLTTVVHVGTLTEAEGVSLLELVETSIRRSGTGNAQGSMPGDGGFVHLYVWHGTVSTGAQLERLRSFDEAGHEVVQLISKLSDRLPGGFVGSRCLVP